MNELQCKTAKAIVNVFETGRVRGHYGSVTPQCHASCLPARPDTTLAARARFFAAFSLITRRYHQDVSSGVRMAVTITEAAT